MTSLTWHEKQGLKGRGGQQNFDFWVTFEWLFFDAKSWTFLRWYVNDHWFWRRQHRKNHSFWTDFEWFTVNLTSKITQNRLFWRAGSPRKNHSFWIDFEWFSRIMKTSLLWIWRQKSLEIDYFERVHLGKITQFGSILSDFQESVRLYYCEFEGVDLISDFLGFKMNDFWVTFF